jgi:hypothetical protein
MVATASQLALAQGLANGSFQRRDAEQLALEFRVGDADEAARVGFALDFHLGRLERGACMAARMAMAAHEAMPARNSQPGLEPDDGEDIGPAAVAALAPHRRDGAASWLQDAVRLGDGALRIRRVPQAERAQRHVDRPRDLSADKSRCTEGRCAPAPASSTTPILLTRSIRRARCIPASENRVVLSRLSEKVLRWQLDLHQPQP